MLWYLNAWAHPCFLLRSVSASPYFLPPSYICLTLASQAHQSVTEQYHTLKTRACSLFPSICCPSSLLQILLLSTDELRIPAILQCPYIFGADFRLMSFMYCHHEVFSQVRFTSGEQTFCFWYYFLLSGTAERRRMHIIQYGIEPIDSEEHYFAPTPFSQGTGGRALGSLRPGNTTLCVTTR